VSNSVGLENNRWWHLVGWCSIAPLFAERVFESGDFQAPASLGPFEVTLNLRKDPKRILEI
jgi:hypothetical protein